MIETHNWLRYAVLGFIATSLVGLSSVSEAKGYQHRYHEEEWRRTHRDWNGHYYWHNNHYYFDHGYRHPAYVENTWPEIGGGVILNNDPYVYFQGSYGTDYPIASLDIDLGSNDRYRHARALYFQRPYFWRDGVRYDRTTVTRGGNRYYRFTRHPY
jgi:hypothetical protein